MSARLPRLLGLFGVAGAAAVVLLVVAVGASPAGALGRPHADQGLLRQCVRAAVGLSGGSATAVAGSAGPQVVAQLAIFRRPRSTADTLPAAAQLRRTLAVAGARTYDPAASVLLTPTGAPGGVFAVPATLAVDRHPTGCARFPRLAGIDAVFALRAQTTGSGPGVCLIPFQSQSTEPSTPTLPGKRRPQPARTITTANARCESDTVLSGYDGALGESLPGATHALAVIPDGVSAITYTLTDGRQVATPVTGNLAVVPTAAVSLPTLPRRVSAAEIGRRFAAALPTTVTESGPGAVAIAALARPPSLIPDFVAQIVLLRGLIGTSTNTSSSSATGSASSSTSVSCSARTHHCIAVTVTTRCDSPAHCDTTRTIDRYRYVGAHPPRGTTAPQSLATAPIRGRVNRYVVHPVKLTLVLSGTRHHDVTVLLSVSCFTHNSSAGGFGGPAPRAAVPSRTPISLPGRASSFRACDVGALAISPRPGRIVVKVVRG